MISTFLTIIAGLLIGVLIGYTFLQARKANSDIKDLKDYLAQTDQDLTIVTEMVNVLSAQNSRLFQIIQSHNSEANP